MAKTRQKSKGPEKKTFCIGIDVMGCESEPMAIVDAIVECLVDFPASYTVMFFGTSSILSQLPAHPQITACVTEEFISMDENPLYAVRRKKKSSTCIAVRMLKTKTIDAFISAGNTGALIASANLFLRLPHIDRTALLTLLPTAKNPVAVLDVGANPACKARHLVEYAAMGIAYQKSRGIPHPKVGLLNIGIESSKGTPEIRHAYQKLEGLNNSTSAQKIFIGNVEGRDVFSGIVDVLVTDGFTGNVFLKTAEGIASFILHELFEQSANYDLLHNAAFGALRKRLHYAEYPGATIAGADGIIIKCHGDGRPSAFRESLKVVIDLLQANFLHRLKEELLTQTTHGKLLSLFR